MLVTGLPRRVRSENRAPPVGTNKKWKGRIPQVDDPVVSFLPECPDQSQFLNPAPPFVVDEETVNLTTALEQAPGLGTHHDREPGDREGRLERGDHGGRQDHVADIAQGNDKEILSFFPNHKFSF